MMIGFLKYAGFSLNVYCSVCFIILPIWIEYMNVLGISCFYHDSAACLVRDGEIVSAVEEERLTRNKHDHLFPVRSIDAVLSAGGIEGKQLDLVVFYEGPSAKTKQLQDQLKESCGYIGDIQYCEHHLSHAASAYYNSPFDDAAILVVDDIGDPATTTLYYAKGTDISPISAVHYPHSLGLLYSTLTSFLGFEVNEGEYRVMGLASYGQPTYLKKLRKLITLNEDGSFTLDLTYFAYMHSRTENYSDKLISLLGAPRRAEAPIEQRHMDIAASIQKLIEEALLNLVSNAKKVTGAKNICMSGCLAHNIVANTFIRDSKVFDNIFIHFASGDSGAAIGAALLGYYDLSKAKKKYKRQSPYLGPSFSDTDIEKALKSRPYKYDKLSHDDLITVVAKLLNDKFIIGWHQGRMEFGPRALGNRSILASACASDMKSILNTRVKYREAFRPFAPVVLADRASEFFELDNESPAMLFSTKVKESKHSVIPSVTHIDGSARPQTIKRKDNPLYYDLISRFAELTGVPVIVNTSFNVRGEPIVCTPSDALNCFAGTDIDYLVIGLYLITK